MDFTIVILAQLVELPLSLKGSGFELRQHQTSCSLCSALSIRSNTVKTIKSGSLSCKNFFHIDLKQIAVNLIIIPVRTLNNVSNNFLKNLYLTFAY